MKNNKIMFLFLKIYNFMTFIKGFHIFLIYHNIALFLQDRLLYPITIHDKLTPLKMTTFYTTYFLILISIVTFNIWK